MRLVEQQQLLLSWSRAGVIVAATGDLLLGLLLLTTEGWAEGGVVLGALVAIRKDLVGRVDLGKSMPESRGTLETLATYLLVRSFGLATSEGRSWGQLLRQFGICGSDVAERGAET